MYGLKQGYAPQEMSLFEGKNVKATMLATTKLVHLL